MSNSGVPYPENSFYTGTLIIDVFDLNTKKLAWQSVLSKVVNPDKKRSND